MNKFIKVLSIVLTIAASTFLPSSMAAETDSVNHQETLNKDVIVIPQETTMKGWPSNGTVRF